MAEMQRTFKAISLVEGMSHRFITLDDTLLVTCLTYAKKI